MSKRIDEIIQKEKAANQLFQNFQQIVALLPPGEHSITLGFPLKPLDIKTLQFFWNADNVGPVDITVEGNIVKVVKTLPSSPDTNEKR